MFRFQRCFLPRVPRAGAVAFVLMMFVPSTASAQGQSAERPIFGGASVGVQIPASDEFSQAASGPFRGETRSQQSTYETASGLAVDVNAGYMLTPRIGASVGFSRFSASGPATFSLTLPHPLVFDSLVTKSGTTADLDHSQRAVHLSAVFAPDLGQAYDLKLFVGPSRIYVDQRLITGIDTVESLPGDGSYDFTISQAVLTDGDVCACAWGFHAGLDLSRFFTPNLGVGALLRYSRATVELQNAARIAIGASGTASGSTAGGLVVGGGVRLRFAYP